MDNDEKTGKLAQAVKMLTAQEADEELLKTLSPEKWRDLMASRRAAKELTMRPIEEAIARSQAGSAVSGYKDWTSGSPTTQQQSKTFYERLAKEAAKDDIVRDINLNEYQMQKAAEAKLARSAALQKIAGMTGKGLSIAGKIAAPIGAIMGLYGDDIAPEGEEFEIPRKLRK